jgi:microcin C transport system substrate-binding protein
MRSLYISLPLVLLVGCGNQQSPAPNSATEQSAGVVTPGDTHLVANPPVYPSEPLPDGLVWITDNDEPTFASPDAKRGGTFHTYIQGFPTTLRLYGPDSSEGDFPGVRRALDIALLDLQPNTLNFIPALATHWAFGADGKTVYYKLNPDARWSDGVPITADDYVFAREFRLSPYLVDPYGQNYFTNIIVAIKKYDDYTISVTSATAKPGNEILYQTNLGPVPRHFHKLDEHWVDNYNWRIEPTTGPYQISRVEKGRYIELKRIDNWWGDEIKYYKNRFNIGTIRIDTIRDENVAFEYFLKGDIDTFLFQSNPARWHDKARGEIFDKGYAGKIQFYNDQPRSARGLWLNMDDPILADKNVRYGLAYAINMDKVLSTVFRNDYERLQSAYQGYYWGYSNPDVHALPFDLNEANKYLDAAGWKQRGPDGIRVKNGQRLSLTIGYASDEHSPWLIVVREEAKKAGIELNLQLLDPAAWGTQLQEKKFQIMVVTTSTYLTPSFWQSYHSENAHKPHTSNMTNTDDPELDKLIDQYEVATTLDTRVKLSREIQAKIADINAFIPLYTIPYTRSTFWRWVKLPPWHSVRITDDVFDPVGLGLLWIDEDEKAETLAAMKSGKTFPPINIVDETWHVK